MKAAVAQGILRMDRAGEGGEGGMDRAWLERPQNTERARKSGSGHRRVEGKDGSSSQSEHILH